jgi:hypothetical protein
MKGHFRSLIRGYLPSFLLIQWLLLLSEREGA